MPKLQTYKCKNELCNPKGEEFFEFLHVPSDEPAECPKCSSGDVEVHFAPKVSHQLKGPNWARDNYGLGSRKK
jgi:hypothetical protein